MRQEADRMGRQPITVPWMGEIKCLKCLMSFKCTALDGLENPDEVKCPECETYTAMVVED